MYSIKLLSLMPDNNQVVFIRPAQSDAISKCVYNKVSETPPHTALHYPTLNYTKLHCPAIHYTMLHYTGAD